MFSRLDYGDALLSALRHSSLAPYQRVINAAVRLVNGLWLHDHVTSAAIDLHWLPAEARIQYKLCLLVHHALCLLYTSPSPRDGLLSRMPSSA